MASKFWKSVFLNHTLSPTFGSQINIVWWTLQDSNLQPTGYEPGALTIELRVRRLDYKINELINKLIQLWMNIYLKKS